MCLSSNSYKIKRYMMDIYLASATGTGTTKLSAFDNALYSAGIANFNLIQLSSVIPAGSNIVEYDGKDIGKWGDRLYMVMAEARTEDFGHEVWAGIGWVQDEETKRGLFVEHTGESKQAVEDSIRASLVDLMKTREVDFGEIHMKISGTKSDGGAVCALVVAAYMSAGWSNA
jgi:arginine decarboxylase